MKGEIPEQAYINRLLDDLRADLDGVQERSLQSIFIGGGTPSLISSDGIKRLLNGIQSYIPFAVDCEITLEANPGTFETERFAGFAAAGVNRLSIGVQSFAAEQLQRLGRIHNPEQARQAAQHAASLPLRSFNLDIMHGLPQQTLAAAMDDLEQAIALNPPHISWYQLTIEPNTAFASRPPRLPDDDTLWEIYQTGQQVLAQAGYQQYEVSAYAKAGEQSKHNRNYWLFGDYLGIGCGAHSKITYPEQNTIERCEKIKHPQGYLDLTRPLRYRQWQVSNDELPFEFFMNQLRLSEPAPKHAFVDYTGLSDELAAALLQPSIDKGLLTETSTHWQTTELGRRYLNSILDTMV